MLTESNATTKNELTLDWGVEQVSIEDLDLGYQSPVSVHVNQIMYGPEIKITFLVGNYEVKSHTIFM